MVSETPTEELLCDYMNLSFAIQAGIPEAEEARVLFLASLSRSEMERLIQGYQEVAERMGCNG